jgi:hypothetical protein
MHGRGHGGALKLKRFILSCADPSRQIGGLSAIVAFLCKILAAPKIGKLALGILNLFRAVQPKPGKFPLPFPSLSASFPFRFIVFWKEKTSI